jgi:hypothetical protein
LVGEPSPDAKEVADGDAFFQRGGFFAASGFDYQAEC